MKKKLTFSSISIRMKMLIKKVAIKAKASNFRLYHDHIVSGHYLGTN